jgi:hypothetical protein
MAEPSDWRRVRDVDGGATCVARGASTVTIHERQRPLAAIDVLVDRCLDRLRAEGATALAPGPAVALTTAEGEYATLVTIAGIHAGVAIEHTVGVIDGDDFHTLVEAHASAPADHAAVHRLARQIVLELPLGLGAVRYRRFRYREPAGWARRDHGLATTWSDPERAATISVLPARPLFQPEAVAKLDNLLRDEPFADFVVERSLVGCEIESAGLTGVVVGVVGAFAGGPRRVILTAALKDARFLYVMRLQTDLAHAVAHEALFLDLVRSCERIPMPASTMIPTLAHWAM